MMEILRRASEYLKYLVAVLGAIAGIAGYLSGEKGLLMQIVAATGVALLVGTIVYALGDSQRKIIYVPPDGSKKTPLPRWTKIVLAVIVILWLSYIAYLMVKEGMFQCRPTLMISSVPGKIDNAVEISFSLEEDKWVGINKTLDAGLLVGTGAMRFYCKGSGAPNTIELKLIHVPDENGKECVCRMLWNQVTNTGDNWISLEAPYTDFKCWASTCPSGESPQLDVSRVHRIDFAISNKADQGDTSGTGIVSLDHVQAFTTNQGASVTPVIVDTMDSTSGWETYR